MLGKGKGKIAMLILAKKKDDDAKKSSSGMDDEKDDGLEAAVEEFCKAEKRGDYAGAAAAFRNMFDIVRGESGKDDDDDDDDDKDEDEDESSSGKY